MKVAVITYSNAQNYGAMLQAYALSNCIADMGIECRVINYRKFDSRWFKPRKTLWDIIFTALLIKQGKKRVCLFHEFRKQFLPLTTRYDSVEELKQIDTEYDLFISGSDQVWNCNGYVNEAFFLRFTAEKAKRCAYAPSFGSRTIPADCMDKVAQYINDFQNISVREKSGADLIKQLTGREAEVVLDPVFLISSNKWCALAHSIEHSKFVFVYTTEVSDDLRKTVCNLYNNKGITVISTQYIAGCNCIVRKDIGPLEFLGYIRDAEYVVSTSFHATAFSIIFQKKFCVVPHKVTGARVTDLLCLIGLQQEIVEDVNSFQFDSFVDWDAVERQLNELKSKSQSYLQKSIAGEQ